MALQEQYEHYYKIDADNTYVENNVLTIKYIVYLNGNERLKEKEVIPLYENAKKELTALLETADDTNIQDYYNLYSSLYYSLYEKTNLDFKDYALPVMKKYNLFLELIPYIENPIKIVHSIELKEYDYVKENPTLTDFYNVLKTRIGKNIDV